MSRGNSETEPSTARRTYRSPLRAQQAAQTRRRIVTAAAECFAENGYSATTLAAIGRRAGVSPESVAANGPKAALLIAAFEQTFVGREGSDPMTGRPELNALLAIPDRDEMLRAVADFQVGIQAQGIGMWRALSAAALDDAAVAERYAELAERRRADHQLAIRALGSLLPLRTDRSEQQLGDTLALLGGFDAYQLFVLDFGWTEEALRDWYIDSFRHLLLA
jgi:AcrR family transcriptional regulator